VPYHDESRSAHTLLSLKRRHRGGVGANSNKGPEGLWRFVRGASEATKTGAKGPCDRRPSIPTELIGRLALAQESCLSFSLPPSLPKSFCFQKKFSCLTIHLQCTNTNGSRRNWYVERPFTSGHLREGGTPSRAADRPFVCNLPSTTRALTSSLQHYCHE